MPGTPRTPGRPARRGGGFRRSGHFPSLVAAFIDARWLCVFYIVTFGGFIGLSGYLPIFFVDRFGIGRVEAAGLAAAAAAAGSFLRPVGGALADRLGGGPGSSPLCSAW